MKRILFIGIAAIVVGLTGTIAHASSQELPKPDCRDLILKGRGAATYLTWQWENQMQGYAHHVEEAEKMVKDATNAIAAYPDCKKMLLERKVQ
jgi:hypothetical protein